MLGDSDFFATLQMSVNDCESFMSIDFGFSYTFKQIGEFANMEYVNNEK